MNFLTEVLYFVTGVVCTFAVSRLNRWIITRNPGMLSNTLSFVHVTTKDWRKTVQPNKKECRFCEASRRWNI
ncbi:hypothetical protein Ocin01_06479 [Orchesella cincta]|uniref:Uncharacterized protein n=1 Tax=Orchesella cincta TaxID=48709 RepID=A0A1D2N4K6_ORCCI|nr:hypothetical protein Ocin01_06479 [Orchesella cincta]